ncbi:DUF934 domain-containing protein [Alphaproteobacteria bacterium LSUCC0684]
MLTIVSREGFSADNWAERPQAGLDDALQRKLPRDAHLRLENTAEVENLIPILSRLDAISVHFPSPHDGRGFSLARKLRNLGYEGALRAEGHLHVGQFRHALECGFTELALSPDVVMRMPEKYWLNAIGERNLSYQQQFLQG